MGLGCSSQKRDELMAIKQSRMIDKALRDTPTNPKTKLLLLGTADSGKSTFIKQMKVIYKSGFSTNEIARYTAILQDNCLQSMQMILQCPNVKITKKLQKDKQIVLETSFNECYQSIERLWAHKNVKDAFDQRAHLSIHIPTSADYYFDNVERFAQDSFVPTSEDILRAKLKTTGISEVVFEFNGMEFTIVDVGGQRSERRKWIHCFEDVTAVIFLVALDEYDMVSDEDLITNRLEESLKLFEETVSSGFVQPSAWILFLNKSDTFENKIKHYPLNNWFSDIPPELGSDYDNGCKYIQSLYEKKFTGGKLYSFITCALDTTNCKKLFLVVRDSILSNFASLVF